MNKERWIKNRPEFERPREKLLKFGSKDLSNSELLAIFLRIGVKDKSAIQLAAEILEKFGGIRGLCTAEIEDLLNIKGLGVAKVAQLKATLELAERYLKEDVKQKSIVESSKEVLNYLHHSMQDLDHELMKVILLDGQNQIINIVDMFRGSISSSSVYPREIIKLALKYSALAIVIVHNHPSGISKPSEGDKKLTKEIIFACISAGIKVHDHIIIGNKKYFSFADEGFIDAYEKEYERRTKL